MSWQRRQKGISRLVQPGKFPGNRGGLCAGSVQCSSQSVGAVQGAKSDHQSSDNRGKRDAACVRKSGGIYEQALI